MSVVEVPEWFNAASYFIDRNVEEGRGNNVAILCGECILTYNEVSACVNQTGHALRTLGVEMENRVMLLLPDCPELACCFFGAMKIGAVPIPVNTLLNAQDYRCLLQDSRAKVLVVSDTLYDAIEPILGDLEHVRGVIVVGDVPGQLQFKGLIEGQETVLDPARTHRDDVAFWLYTSGTTGLPRAAVHLHHDMVYSVEHYFKGVLGIGEGDRTFSVAKLFFAYGLGNALYGPFAVGASTVLFPGRPQPDAIFKLVDRHRPTLFFGVPTAFAGMLHAVERGARAHMPSVRVAISAGESLPPSIYERWLEQFGVEILDGIGSTEILHIFVSNREGAVRPGSTGTVVPGYEVRIFDPNGEPVPVGEVGSLIIKGESTCASYWNRHEMTKRTIIGEWIRTGDQYRVDEDGYFWNAGRSDDMLKVGGIWVSPVEVESVIVEHPAVLECAVVASEDDEGLVKPRAFVVLKDSASADDELAVAIQQFVKNRIAPYKYPRWVDFVEELPKTATGKIQRFKLREAASGGGA
jgi:benzoate-CoA ligase family protein